MIHHLFFLLIVWLGCQSILMHSYASYIQHKAQVWRSTCQEHLATPQAVDNIVIIITLSKDITIQSCTICLAKNHIQQELLNLYTPSLSDSWQKNLQATKNDISIMQQELLVIAECQSRLESILEQLQEQAPIIIQHSPLPIQLFIADMKSALLYWLKEQEPIDHELDGVRIEFEEALNAIVHIKSILSSIFQETYLQNHHLKQAAGSLSKTHHDIDFVIQHITQIRHEMLVKLQEFFITFFNTYEQTIAEGR